MLDSKSVSVDYPMPVVKTSEGAVRGKTGKTYDGKTFYKFFGIPYAKAPTGELRFKAPEEPVPWNGVRDARKEGPACPSRHIVLYNIIGKEDNCLNLNIYTRSIDSYTTEKPVMVFIHGGAFMCGSNSTELYGPEFLLSEDVVLVVINYRTGILGFLALDDDTLGVPGNAGLKDQVMALKWVQKNIRAFNGDPNNVTIFGQSAGAACVHLLMLSPLAKGLFHKAIIQSGSTLNLWAKGHINGDYVASLMGYEETNEKEILKKLQNEDVQLLVKAQHKFNETCTFDKQRPLAPVIEKPGPEAFISENPIKIIESGEYNKIPLMIGCTSNEGIVFEMLRTRFKLKISDNLWDDVPFDMDFESFVVDDIAKELREFYFGNEKPSKSHVNNIYRMKSDIGFKYHMYQTMSLHALSEDTPTFAYIMNLSGNYNMFKKLSLSKRPYLSAACVVGAVLFQKWEKAHKFFHKLLDTVPTESAPGAAHCDELTYLFYQKGFHPHVESGTKDEMHIRRILKLWTNFSKYGHPTPEKLEIFDEVLWEPVTTERFNYLMIDHEIELKENPDAELIQFWDKIYKTYGDRDKIYRSYINGDVVYKNTDEI